jgi:4'-phosphopantetheinyl transferase
MPKMEHQVSLKTLARVAVLCRDAALPKPLRAITPHMSTWASSGNVVPGASTLAQRQAHFWRVEVASTHSIHSSDWLDPAEIAMADRFYRFADRARFSVGRTALRLLLAGYLKTSPHLLRFECSSHGKPLLSEARDLNFNISHSGGWIVLGVAKGLAVGVDVERIIPMPDAANLTRFCFSEAERQPIEMELSERSPIGFFRAWTRKEAYLKMLGVGLVDDLYSLDCHVKAPDLMEIVGPGAHRALVSLHEASPAEGYVAALVTDEPGCAVKRWTFDPRAFASSFNESAHAEKDKGL